MNFSSKNILLLTFLLIVSTQMLYAQQPQTSKTTDYQQGLTLFQKGIYKQSSVELKRFIKQHPGHPLTASARFYYVRSLSQMNPDHKAAFYQRFIQSHPNSVFSQKLLFDMAYMAKKANDYEKAMRYYQQVITHNVTNKQKSRTYYWMGQTAEEMDNLAQAQRYYQQIYDKFPDSDLAPKALYAKGRLLLMTEQFNSASATFELLQREYPNDEVTRRVGTALGEAYYKQEQYKKAVEALKESMSYIKKDQKTKAVLLIAESYNALGKLDKASTSYRRYINLTEGTDAERAAHYGLGWVFYKREIYHWAAKEFAKAAKGNDLIARKALYYKAINEKMAGKFQQSIKTFRTFADKYTSGPWFEKGYYEYAVTAYEMGRYGEAIRTLLTTVRSDEKLKWKGKIFMLLGQAYFANDEFSRALQAYKAADQLTDVPVEVKRKVKFQKAWLLFSGEAYDQAQEIFESLYEEAPNTKIGKKALFWNADSYFNMGQYGAAASRFKQFAQNNPDHELAGAAFYSLGWSYFKMGQYAQAIQPFQHFLTSYEAPEISVFPYDVDTQLRIGDSYYALSKYNKAIQAYKKLVGDDTGGDYALFQIGNSYYRMENNYKAVTTFRKVLQMYPNSSLREQAQYNVAYVYLNAGNYEQAITELKKIISQFPGTSWAALAQYNIGDAYYNSGQYKKAIAAYQKVLQNYPQSEYVIEAASGIDYSKAAIATGTTTQKDTLSALESFIENNPEATSPSLLYKQAERLMQTGDYITATKKLESLVKSAEDKSLRASAYLDLAESYTHINQTSNALNTYQKVIQQFPNTDASATALTELGNLKLKQGQTQQAIDYYKQAITNGSGNKAKAHTGWGETLLALNNLQEAKKHFNQALSLNSDYARAKIGLARVEINKGNLSQARGLLAPIANSNTQSAGAEAQYLLGKIQLKQDNFAQAVETFSKVQVLYKFYDQWVAKAIMGSAKAQIQQGNKGQARKLLEELINQYPDTPEAQTATQMLEN